jgi:hypothetical protein
MRLVQAARKGKLGHEILNTDFTLVTENNPEIGYRIRAATNPLPAELLLENIMMNVAAACFMQFDEIANQVFNTQRFSNADDDLRNTLTVLYLVRCAFAHNPLVPTWLIAPRFRNNVIGV